MFPNVSLSTNMTALFDEFLTKYRITPGDKIPEM